MTPILTITLNPALDIAASVDEIIIGPKLRCEGGQFTPGGGGVNVTRAIDILGGESEAFVATAGVLGELLVKQLRKHDVDPIRYETDGHTRQSLSIFEETSGKQLRLVLPGPIWTERQIKRLLDSIMVHVEEGALVVASGSLPPGLPDDQYIKLNTALQDKGAQMVLDTSEDTLITSVKSAVHPYAVLRMNRIEAETLSGRTFPNAKGMADFGQQLIADNIAKVVVMARGGEGSVFVSATERLHIQNPKTKILSAVGAGDSLVGGLTLALAQGKSLQEAGILAASAASSTVQTSASDLCLRDVVEQIMTTCTVTKL
ncbi:MAG: 1-phosphofructokinase family hexose kinase [Alphaproteobacteria bacterium]